ncbi:BREX-2 system phosphatase PglZ [Catellatospora bangladeshensis]|uniref:PglZ domain-containing protein n=1 Tax=Catellatospora bangladeshensis TaxID=310355 RepID=A0A8J3JS30_9ACTN|nr:BREX-2 system phosphatase PglZ [Catellatospora bangladeshensis]GIF85897.1 hypothetical protein Cba03nite_72460 [Catellatospora bangladeshensis]
MTTAPAQHLLRINPVALRQKVGQQLERHHTAEPYPIVVVRAEPAWPHDRELPLTDGRSARVVPCVSPLAVWEQVASDRGNEVLILLTDVAESSLGHGVLSRVFRQRVITVQPWDLVVDAFGAQQPDAALEAESWAGEALLDAMPPAGWPKLTTAVLTRDVALRHLAAVRLGLHRLGAEPDDLDVAMLLRWSALPGAIEAFQLLRPAERDGLARWLTDRFGRPAKALFALIAAGHGTDALPLGLVCDALWTTVSPDAARAQGRIDQYFGRFDRDDQTIESFAAATTDAVVAMLAAPARDAAVRRQGHAVLDRAEELLIQFGAADCAGHSRILRSGFAHRIGVAASALQAATAGRDEPALAAAVVHLAEHELAEPEAERIRRVRMAQRLVQWLASSVEPLASVADGVDRQLTQWSWVDVALNHVWAGDDLHPGLQAAFRDIHQQASRRRSELDAAFAHRLAAWVGSGNDGDLLTVENLLPTVVDPLLRADRPSLLVVLDGMSAAVAVELADELSQHWVEYDPLAGDCPARRRAVVAALPTLTAVSRTSLFSGCLATGDQDTEVQVFAKGRWGKHSRIFHKGPGRGGAGEVLASGLAQAVADPAATVVAVVINTIDESLAYGREGYDAGWSIGDIGFLRSLLDLARSSGRAVIITSDHGHVLDRGSELVRAADAASARHRTGTTPAVDGEIELAGPRVLAPGNRIISLWDAQRRYRPGRAGYHGGASLAEVTIPLMAFLLPNVTDIPRGWAPLDVPQPDWWQPSPVKDTRPPATTTPAPKSRRKPAAAPAAEALFDVPATPAPAQATDGNVELITALLANELFEAQHGLTPRRLPIEKVQAALTALLDANGVLPLAVLAERAGEAPARANGFVVTLQRIFNVDNYPVLSLTDNGRTARLDERLLRLQFRLPGATS